MFSTKHELLFLSCWRPDQLKGHGKLINWVNELAGLEPMSSELVIEDMQLGTGAEAVKGALITTHYRGTLDNGAEFDSSYSRGKPFQCVIGTGRVIKGWDQGIMGMKVGGRRKLFVPAHLAYGERQMGALIKPNSNLVFEIELLEVLTRDE